MCQRTLEDAVFFSAWPLPGTDSPIAFKPLNFIEVKHYGYHYFHLIKYDTDRITAEAQMIFYM